ncbi:hypothetical protein F443_17380 [Phytophthora nicotianae P1569]|uniref:Uncharacterized protein n=5 Tax=Phytophthora nicotianae TaxID=4792 RepID=V9EDI8_PHYNI|nr:hypothetical protein F443_17380 [Phytophthora nicotianae P1569]ETO65252.1 hypothetical protein F444_17411 [Phytophthora nicotianae P1976]
MYDVYGRCVQPEEPRQDQEEEGRLVKIEKTLARLEGLLQAIAAKVGVEIDDDDLAPVPPSESEEQATRPSESMEQPT